ncbi:hypothetical protein [Glycomyces xiaoerkulensis]|nr:hypothetical protein [Glycomyces xiaoerkulensis]
MTEPVGETKLENQYQAAWEEWYASEDAELWDRITGDGLEPEAERR